MHDDCHCVSLSAYGGAPQTTSPTSATYFSTVGADKRHGAVSDVGDVDSRFLRVSVRASDFLCVSVRARGLQPGLVISGRALINMVFGQYGYRGMPTGYVLHMLFYAAVLLVPGILMWFMTNAIRRMSARLDEASGPRNSF